MSSHISFELHQHHVYVPVHAGGERLWWILDTGAGLSLIDTTVARRLGATLGASIVARGAGDGTLTGAILDSPLTVVPGDEPGMGLDVRVALPFDAIAQAAGRPVDGVLGSDFIARHVVEIDYRRQRLRLHETDGFSHAGTGVSIPIELRMNHPHVRGAVRLADGRRVEADFVVDVGSGMGVSLTHAFAAAHAIEPAAIAAGPIPAGRGVGGAAAASLVRLAAVDIGGVSLADPLVAIFGDGAGVMSSGEFFDGNLGGEFLRRYTLFLDYAGMRIILEPAANA